jgi:hypothetical protein
MTKRLGALILETIMDQTPWKSVRYRQRSLAPHLGSSEGTPELINRLLKETIQYATSLSQSSENSIVYCDESKFSLQTTLWNAKRFL